MKRDMDLVRKILISMGDNKDNDLCENIDHDVYQYHIWLMQQANLIDDFSRYGPEGGSAKISLELTWEGNEFLEAARSESIWQQAKSKFKESAGALPFEVFKGVLLQLIKSQIS